MVFDVHLKMKADSSLAASGLEVQTACSANRDSGLPSSSDLGCSSDFRHPGNAVCTPVS